MGIVEPIFPRGGKLKTKPKKKSDSLFGGFFEKKKKKIVNKKNTKYDLKSQSVDKIEPYAADLLSYKTIQEGMIVMGCIKSMDPTSLKVLLPGRIVGKVLASAISESYSKIIEAYIDNNEISEPFKPVNELFTVGQIVCVKVMQIENQNNENISISLSLKPGDIHSNMHHENICKGMFLYGAIAEVQEHGYIMETGIKNLRCFVPIDKSDDNLQDSIGQIMALKIQKMTQNNTASTAICKIVNNQKKTIKDLSEPNLDYILPTTIVNFKITKIFKNGLQGTIMCETFTGYVNEHQLSEPLSMPIDYEVDTTLKARLLYIMPLTKVVYLSLYTEDLISRQQSYQIGEIINEAEVHHVGTNGLIFSLDGQTKGLIPFKILKSAMHSNYDQEEVLAKYRKDSKHKLRIIEYDPIDYLYICSNNARDLAEKYFTITDVKAGDIVTATVNEKDGHGRYVVFVGKLRGLIEPIYLASSGLKTLQEGTKIKCRVLTVYTDRKIIHLTNRLEYMKKNINILADLSNVKADSVFLGTIIKCYDSYYLVKFFNDIKGLLKKNQLIVRSESDLSSFCEGLTINFRIDSIKNGKLTIGLVDDIDNFGEIYNATITNVFENGLEISTNNDTLGKGFVPVELLSDFSSLVPIHLKRFSIGDELKVCGIKGNIYSVRDVVYFESNQIPNWSSLKRDNILRAYIENVSEDIVELNLAVKKLYQPKKLRLNMFANYLSDKSNVTVVPNQVVLVKVLKKNNKSRTLNLSAKLTDVWNGNLTYTATWFQIYMEELKSIQQSLAAKDEGIAMFTLGQKTTGTIIGLDEDDKNLNIELPYGVRGIIRSSLFEKGKVPTDDEQIECIVLWIDYVKGIVFLSHRRADIDRINSNFELPKKYENKNDIPCKILLVHEDVLVCSMKKSNNPLVIVPKRIHFNDFTSMTAFAKEGEFCQLSFIHKNFPIAVLEKVNKLCKKILTNCEKVKAENKKENKFLHADRHSNSNAEEELSTSVYNNSKKRQFEENDEETIVKKTKPNINDSKKTKKKVTKLEPLQASDNESDGSKLSYSELNGSQSKMNSITDIEPVLPGVVGFWSMETDDNADTQPNKISHDDDELSVEIDHKKKRKTTAEKFKAARDEEDRIRKIEDMYADTNSQPQSEEQFDRLAMADPNNSVTWINYMAFHIKMMDVDAARSIARKALKTISYRETQELLNVWIALLNLEMRYGCKESFNEVLKESVLCNDPFQIYTRCLHILTEGKNEQDVVNMVSVVTKKFKEKPEIWKCSAIAYFEIGMIEKAKQLLNKALTVLQEREHVNMIVTFANLNHKYNEVDTAHALIEQIITSYPKRVDVWSLYVDMLIKDKLHDAARKTLERAIAQKIPLKKMRVIFKKYLEFEERFGNEENVQKVKKMAAEYVKNEINI